MSEKKSMKVKKDIKPESVLAAKCTGMTKVVKVRLAGKTGTAASERFVVTKSASAKALAATKILRSPAAVVRPGVKAAVKKVIAKEFATEKAA